MLTYQQIIYVFLGLFLFLLIKIILWVFNPYFVWRRSETRQSLTIRKAGSKVQHSLGQFKSMGPAPHFSLVVPAYNEQSRISKMLDQTIPYFQNLNQSFQILVVNDGSKDKTSQVVLAYPTQAPLYLVQYGANRGKGGAVRAGMQAARGEIALMVDADGATQIQQFEKVLKKLQIREINGKKLGISAGSRHHLREESLADRLPHRKLLGMISNFLIKTICRVRLNDTQCGFKIFTKDTKELIFPVQHLQRWSFDIQLFMIANNFEIPCQEVPVRWRDVQGSKLNVVDASTQMLRDMVLLRLLYGLGLWKFTDRVSQL